MPESLGSLTCLLLAVVSLGKLPYLSEPPFLNLKNGNTTTYSHRITERIK